MQASLPGTPRRAADVVGLVLLRWFDLVGQRQWQSKSAGDEIQRLQRDVLHAARVIRRVIVTFAAIPGCSWACIVVCRGG